MCWIIGTASFVLKSTPKARSQKNLKWMMKKTSRCIKLNVSLLTWKKKMVNAGLLGYLKIFALSKKLDPIKATMGLIALPLKVF